MLLQLRFHGELYSECQMAEFPKSSKESSKNEAPKRSSSDTRDKNVPKQQKRMDYPVQMLPAMKLAVSKPSAFRDFKSIRQNLFNNNKVASNQEQGFVAGTSGVDADKGSGSCKDPSVEISPKEKSLQAAHKLDLNSSLPDLNVVPPELMSINDVDEVSNFQNGPSFVADDLQDVVKVVRKLEIEGHISRTFRLKFLTWYGLHSTATECDVVHTFIQTLNDDLSCLAGQLIDSFSGIINMRS
ncbi:uncharacterized protein [Primulina huaijiensis]|uniref:uncharacterized protein isoform X2 n=1 Tax=Primulina huaijiensis TaxID=1492673 RepID=UPI003CC777A8